MQAVTIAIGPAGVSAFAKQMMAGPMVTTLSKLAPPDRGLGLPTIQHRGDVVETWTNIWISIAGGSLSGFTPAYGNAVQSPDGQFVLSFTAPAFSAHYNWDERFHYEWCSPDNWGRPHCTTNEDRSNHFSYGPTVGSLAATVTLKFAYDKPSNTYDLTVVGTSGTPSNVATNIPGSSVVQQEVGGCGDHVSAATRDALNNIPFGPAIAGVFQPLLKTIPASGKLTSDITYDFAVGDSGLTFPGDAGIGIGVTGTVKYKDQSYDGPAPKPLPVPPPPVGPDHVQVYVSDYEMNALHWAFFKAGLLAVTVHPSDLQDSDILKVKTYVSAIQAFKPYSGDAMTAHVVPKAAPVVAFGDVYELTAEVMGQLKGSLPTDVYTLLGGIDGNAYANKADLETDLQSANVEQLWWATIESAAKSAGMVVTQTLEFKLVIENGAPTPPELVFDLQRTDILQNLGLGLTKTGAQTLQYAFQRVSYSATFVSTTVPKFDKRDFGDLIWPTAGEPRYEEALAAMGKTGVPLPIMQGFHFVFDQAKVSIQEGFVSVLAQVNLVSREAALGLA
jgi:hypothetical protein